MDKEKTNENPLKVFSDSIQENEIKYDDLEMIDELSNMKVETEQIQKFFEESKIKYND
ncbi:MAG: hypothetical protein MJ252_16080 [archaeon]|nr:hypothetical protein [archaeon]